MRNHTELVEARDIVAAVLAVLPTAERRELLWSLENDGRTRNTKRFTDAMRHAQAFLLVQEDPSRRGLTRRQQELLREVENRRRAEAVRRDVEWLLRFGAPIQHDAPALTDNKCSHPECMGCRLFEANVHFA